MTSARRIVPHLVLALLLLLLLVFTYQVVRTVLELRQARIAANQLPGELRRNDTEALEQTLRELEDSSRTAHSHSHNLLWDAAAALPFLGDDVTAVQVLSGALADASRDAYAPATTVLTELQTARLREPDGRIDLAAVGRLSEPVEELGTVLARASGEVDDLETDSLLGPLRDVTLGVQRQLGDSLAATRGGMTLTRLLPPMLGAEGPRRYLLVVQNNAETRATGGLPGSLSILEARDGKLTLGAQRAVEDFEVLDEPVLPLTEGERALYGDNLGQNIRDTNLTPDFPRAAELMAALHERSFDQPVDGVVAVDPVALAAVLRATGPVKVGGERFTARNVVPKLLNEVYLELGTRKEQTAYFDRAARGIFDSLITREVPPLRLLRQLGRATEQRRLLVWSARPEEQARLAGTRSSGALPRDTGEVPRVGLYLNDATAAKIEYYLDYRASIRSTGCSVDGAQDLRVGMVLSSSAPRRGYRLSPFVTGAGRYAAKGTMRLNLRIYAPTGGKITGLTANGDPVRLATTDDRGRQVAVVTMFIRARQQLRLAAEIRTAPGQSADPRLRWTPGVWTEKSGTSAASSC